MNPQLDRTIIQQKETLERESKALDAILIIKSFFLHEIQSVAILPQQFVPR